MTLRDFMELFTDADFQKIELYDLHSEDTVFKGEYEDCPSKYDYVEICSVDTMYTKDDTLYINIDLSE